VSATHDRVDKSQNDDLKSWIIAMPKPELHVHLEGTMLPQTYARLARRNGIETTVDPDALYHCSDFPSFLKCFLTVVDVLRTPQDFGEIAAEYLERASDDGIRHAEFFISPATQRKFAPDLDFVGAMQSIHDAANTAERNRGISSLVLIDMVRNLGEEEALRDIELAKKCREYGVVGVGLGGDESRFPARDFRRAFDKAKELGLRRTTHAGEAAGVQSIVDAVELLNAERIGHGVAARGQKEVQSLLRERGVTIDACITSNVFTGAVKTGETHPLREWLDAGLSVTLSSDDPAFFGASVSDEYVKAAGMGLSRTTLAKIAKNGFAASFAGGERIQELCGEVDAYVALSNLPAG
jgi:aminodeoxyfutalosine deaminase